MRAITGAILILAAVHALSTACVVFGDDGRAVLGLTGFALFIVGVVFLFIKDKPSP